MKDLSGIEEIKIIIKNQDDQQETTIGWVAELKNGGKKYGNVLWLQKETPMEIVRVAIKAVIENMEKTIDVLEEEHGDVDDRNAGH